MTDGIELNDNVDRTLPQYTALIAASKCIDSKRYSIRTKHMEAIKEALIEYLNNRINQS